MKGANSNEVHICNLDFTQPHSPSLTHERSIDMAQTSLSNDSSLVDRFLLRHHSIFATTKKNELLYWATSNQNDDE